MKFAGSLVVVAMVASSARADDAADVSAAFDKHSAGAMEAILADSVRVGPIVFKDAACRKRFATPATVTGADRKTLAACLGQIYAMPAGGGGIGLPPLAMTWNDISTHALLAVTMTDHRITAIGPYDVQKDDAALATMQSSGVGDRFHPSKALQQEIDYATKKPFAVVKSCAKPKAKITSRIVTGSGNATFDKEARAYLAQLAIPAGEIALDGHAISACVVWSLHATPVRVKDIVQPVKIEKKDPNGDENGVEGGVEGGIEGGDYPPPPPPPPPPQQNVAPATLEANRIAGNKRIAPDDETKKQIAASGKSRVIGSFKLCVSTAGDVTQIVILKSTGFDAYDAKLRREMADWKYRPFLVNGRAAPVCTAVTFIFSS